MVAFRNRSQDLSLSPETHCSEFFLSFSSFFFGKKNRFGREKIAGGVWLCCLACCTVYFEVGDLADGRLYSSIGGVYVVSVKRFGVFWLVYKG